MSRERGNAVTELVANHPLEVEASTASHWVGSWRNLAMVFVYEGSHDDVGHIVTTGRVIERLAARGPVRTLGVLPADGKPPTAEVRDAFIAIGKRLGSKLDRVAFVVPGAGFRAATHRAAVNGLIMLLRPKVPVRIESDPAQALAFLVDEDLAARTALSELVRRRSRGPA